MIDIPCADENPAIDVGEKSRKFTHGQHVLHTIKTAGFLISIKNWVFNRKEYRLTKLIELLLKKDDLDALSQLNRLSDEGNFRASRAVAYWRYKKGDNNSAFIYALRAAQAGDAYSQAWIADYYEQGVDITQDYQKAVYWATKSMEQNDRYGLLMYGRLLFDGHGVAVDKDKAMALLQQSAVIGFAKAYCEIGRFHLCNGNISSALKAFKKAAREKEPLSCYQLGFRYLNEITRNNEGQSPIMRRK